MLAAACRAVAVLRDIYALAGKLVAVVCFDSRSNLCICSVDCCIVVCSLELHLDGRLLLLDHYLVVVVVVMVLPRESCKVQLVLLVAGAVLVVGTARVSLGIPYSFRTPVGLVIPLVRPVHSKVWELVVEFGSLYSVHIHQLLLPCSRVRSLYIRNS